MIVTKFGGSSSANSRQFKKIKEIVGSDERRKVVVVSAPGKDSDENFKITDILHLTFLLSREQLDSSEVFGKIANRYRNIHKDLKLNFPLEEELDIISKTLASGTSEDYVLSRGEYLNALLLAEFLGYKFVDAKDLICFDNERKYDKSASYKLLREFAINGFSGIKGIVVPGFYGADPDGEIVTFPRGGSDISGAILAAAFEAELYENWTDVRGFLAADPKIIDNPKRINSLSYVELRELSYSDSQIIQADAISATREAGIPLQIKNTNYPEDPGTLIYSGKKAGNGQLVTGIAGQKNFTVIHLKKYDKNEDYGFMRKICTVFEAHKISIHHMPTSLDTISIIFHIDNNKELDQITEQINLYCRPEHISYEQNMALITVVGENMAYQYGIAGKVFTALGKNGVNIRMITQGSSEYNIIVGVESSQYNLAIQTLYDYFFAEDQENE